jgi:hypothetical protein
LGPAEGWPGRIRRCRRPAGHDGFSRFNVSPAPPAAELGVRRRGSEPCSGATRRVPGNAPSLTRGPRERAVQRCKGRQWLARKPGP